MSTPNVTDFTWGFFDDDSADPDTCTQIGSDDSTSETHAVDTNLMVRIGTQNDSTANLNAAAQLQYRVDTGGTWTNVTASSSNVRSSAGTPTDGAVCNTQLLASGSGTFETDGAYDEVDGIVGAVAHTKTTFFEDQWCVQLRSAELSGSEVIFFRTVFAGAVMNYGTDPTGLPQIEAVVAATDSNATAALTLPSLTASGTATHVAPQHNATATLVLAALLAAGTATHAIGANDATASLSLPALTLSATATHVAPIELFDSTYIASGGEATTAQLDPPSGTTTGDFSVGRIEDLDNPADSISAKTDGYTELEWAIKARKDGTYKFRLTLSGTPIPLDITPKLTVSASTASNGTAALTLAALTASGTATFVKPEVQATASVSLPALTASGTATFSNIDRDATAALTLPALTASGTATFVKPEVQATAALTLPSLTASGTATHALGPSNATAALTLQALTAAGTATHAITERQASAALTLPALTASGTAEFPHSQGTASLTLPALTASGTATHALGPSDATAALTLPALTATGTATHAISPSNATAALTLSALTASGTATHVPPEFQATAAVSLPALTASGTATYVEPPSNATASLTLPALTASGTATHALGPSNATASLSLPALTASGTATHTPPTYNASSTIDLPALVASGTATFVKPEVQATASLTLPALTASGTAEFPHSQGTASLSLPALTASGTALHDIQELEGFRWRYDDGTEITATWRELQDVVESVGAGTELRLRIIIQVPEGGAYTIECAEDGTEDWFELEGPP